MTAVVRQVSTDGALATEAEQLLVVLQRETEPVGARSATRTLTDAGTQLSQASVSRIFLQLDELGLTEPVGRRGRVLTALGRQHVTRRLADRQRCDDLGRALEIRTVQQLSDWLHARRGVESEVARAAANRARKSDLTRLRKLVTAHERQVLSGADPTKVALRFHQELARATDGPLFEALVNSLHAPELVPLEELLGTA